MPDVFRILDRFKITGRGMVYTIKKDKDTIICIGDNLYDLYGNQFKIKEVEMFRGVFGEVGIDEIPIGILLELVNGVEVEGNILIRDQKNMNFLFCSHPLYPNKVDEDYKEEYQAASNTYPCALFSYEDMEVGRLSLYGEEICGLTIYRGWMMRPEMYRHFYFLLEKKGIILINTPEEYEKYHLLPGWYNDFKDKTLESVWETQGKLEDAILMSKGLEGPYIVKDYVKSRKHEWYEACFIKDIKDIENVSKVIRNFIGRQGSSFVGGVVLRKFEKLKQIGFHKRSGMPLSEEYRVFIYAGKILTISDYWMEESGIEISNKEYQWIELIAKSIKSNFITLDLARKEDGSLIIMEFGDGQVSGLQQLEEGMFYQSFPI